MLRCRQTGGTVLAIERVLRILEVLSRETNGASVTDLAQAVGAPVSTVHRLLTILVEQGFVMQDRRSRRYHVGAGFVRLAQAFLQRRSLATEARQYLERLTDECGETSFVTSMVDSVPVCVAIAECHRPLRLFIEVGQRMPFHAAASARAILAFRDEVTVKRLLEGEPFESYTGATPRTHDEVVRLLPEIVRLGYAVCEEELDENVTAVSAPIRDEHGRVDASVTVVAPAERMRGERRSEVVAAVKATALDISLSQGYGIDLDPDAFADRAS